MLIKLHDLKNHFDLKILGVIHAGAHMAEESADYVSLGIDNVLWIEANPDLIQTVESIVPKSNIVICAAVSNVDDQEIDFNVCSNSECSSILELKQHSVVYPHITKTHTIKVKTKTIDSIIHQAKKKFPEKKFNFLNLDIQGAEYFAIRGAEKTLHDIDYIYTEVNFVEMYAGCINIFGFDYVLEKNGFVRAALVDSGNGWGDAFYIKEKLI